MIPAFTSMMWYVLSWYALHLCQHSLVVILICLLDECMPSFTAVDRELRFTCRETVHHLTRTQNTSYGVLVINNASWFWFSVSFRVAGKWIASCEAEMASNGDSWLQLAPIWAHACELILGRPGSKMDQCTWSTGFWYRLSRPCSEWSFTARGSGLQKHTYAI